MSSDRGMLSTLPTVMSVFLHYFSLDVDSVHICIYQDSPLSVTPSSPLLESILGGFNFHSHIHNTCEANKNFYRHMLVHFSL